ncbi:histidine ammonia-lyase [Paramuricea clavata]|uniref:Histidine ammonia-lyase n=1 Tax=Paramuricea clavata TaxID=317549 RepID=A0A7D9LK69_PARCT|nr:histidine ammonia-lyase [Paramuricea clavata]
MRVHVKFEDKCLVIPCKDGKQSIKWLISEAVERFRKLRSTESTVGSQLDGLSNMPSCLYLPNGGESNEQGQDFKKEINDGCRASKIPRLNTPSKVSLDGDSLTVQLLVQLGTGEWKIQITHDALRHVKESRDLVDRIVSESRVVYGINTGFGKFAQKVISDEKLGELQENLIRSHAAGVGNPLTQEQTRMLMALRINVLAKGYSGISLENLERIVEAFNASCLPWIPEQGTVGASGDLAPLAHLALGLMGEGKMWSRKSGWADAKLVLDAHGLKPIVLGPKEGLAMINGTQLITAIGTEGM